MKRGSISVNVTRHSTQRQPRGADDTVKPCLWRLHARCRRAAIWSSLAKADRQTALSHAASESVSQSFHRDGNVPASVKSVQHCLNSNIYTGASACCRTDGLSTDRKTLAKNHQNSAFYTQEWSTISSNFAGKQLMLSSQELKLKGVNMPHFWEEIGLFIV